MITHTLKETLENKINSYAPFARESTGFYSIKFDEKIEITAWNGELDDDPSIIQLEEWDKLPTDGWLHNDDCTCEECEEEEDGL